jgi:hypothetical protein
MNHSIPNLEIRVHKLDGTVSTFVQHDVEIAKQIMDAFEPTQIFNRQNLVLADNSCHTSFPVTQVTRIDLDSEQHSHLIFESGLVEAVELTRDEFDTLIRNITIRDQWKHLGEEDAFVVTFLNVEMADGQCVLLTMEVDAESPQGLSELRDFLLSRCGLCFRMRSGGVSVLNLANLARLTFFPGTVQPPADAWNVRLLEPMQPVDPAANPVILAPANPSLSPRNKLSIATEYKWDSKMENH